ncbi:MAG TPA: serine protease [Cytophagaceae bacterium]|jgi:S1-C subfamily serine protease|nr:serine protease [Cytophagaceae bacterium]
MKYLRYSFLLLFVGTTTCFAQADDDLPHALIHFVRTDSFLGSECHSDITLPHHSPFNLPLKGIVDYIIYSEGEIPVKIDISCPYTRGPGPRSTTKQVILNITRGNEYYVVYNGIEVDAVKKEDAAKYMKKITTIIKQKEKLDSSVTKTSLAKTVPVKKNSKTQGTCFLISSEGYLITNYHCIENGGEIIVRGIDGDFTTKYAVTVVASDLSNDLVLLKLSNKNLKFNSVPFALKTTGILQAEKIYTLGYPNVVKTEEELKATEGIISAKSSVQGDLSKFQISAAVSSGNSGGPLMDEEGNVIGVINSKSTVAGSSGTAIKASYLDAFLKNVEGFVYPSYVNTLKSKSLTDKVEVLKNYIFIIETN